MVLCFDFVVIGIVGLVWCGWIVGDGVFFVFQIVFVVFDEGVYLDFFVCVYVVGIEFVYYVEFVV